MEDLLDFVSVAHEEGLSGEHLNEDAANRPDVNSSCVLLLPEEYFWGPVPQGFYFVCEGLLGDHYQSGEAKVCDFNIF